MTNSDRAFVELKAMERTRKIVLLSYDHQIMASEENFFGRPGRRWLKSSNRSIRN